MSLSSASKCAVVTGGTRGIGKSVIARLAAIDPELRIAVLSRNKDKDNDNANTRIAHYPCDIAKPEEVASVAQTIIRDHGTIEYLFNCAGVSHDGLLVRMDLHAIQTVLNTNLLGSIVAAKHFSKPMMKQKRGAIINIGSVVGQTGSVGQSVYSASKSALHGFTRSLALELSQFNVTVNMVSPGFIDTDMTKDLSAERRSLLLSQIPLRRFGKGSDVAELAVFVANQPYITGQTFTIDGGLSIA